ncbi:hypothetical protein K504DRAFT_44984 [Pleomassaria siparia CBS 279.74]|uniref:FAD/NAD(P)-binding domain-containing protein n=1 Tax=Pleomassaria siparia CBS 279.74 TaxID=1314801 RepID=A0A6G1K5M6_9PLEO|nr:hypothetical protein K504DRAFT_44984 [Pleomassaria siparia CBS 279.74]
MSSPKKSVAIIGAGLGGLVAARKLLQTNKLRVTIFEKGSRVGGLWAADSPINPEMRTNSSIFTAAFSDLSWESVDLDGQPAPVYPKAWMVERYLQEYTKRLILEAHGESERRLILGVQVVSATRVDGRWRIETRTELEEENVEYFDYMVVATGYLSEAKPLCYEMDDSVQSSIPIMHSTEYRQLHQLRLGDGNRNPDSKPRRVLVVGGSHSGSDMAHLIGLQASNERWAPGKSGSSPPVEVVHITPQQLFAVPAFPRNYDLPCAFHPLEYKLFDRASRGTDLISHEFGMADTRLSKATRLKVKMYVDGSLDGFDADANDLPPYCVISETYNELVRNGVVKPIMAQLIRLREGDNGKAVATIISLSGEETKLDNIAAVINATGFISRRGLSFLSEAVQTELGCDLDNARVPLILDSTYLCQRSNVPDIAFLGYNGVISWGIVEMQMRAVAAKWSSDQAALASEKEETCKAVVDHIQAMRDAMKENRRSEIPQVPFSDYIGMMEQAGRELSLERVDLAYSPVEGFVCAARWVDSDMGKEEAVKTMTRLQDIQRKATEGRMFLARAVFHGLSGKWVGERQVQDGVELTQKVEMHARYPTAPDYHFEYVAVETLTTKSTTSEHTDERRTILRYTENSDEVSAWEVSPHDPLLAKPIPSYKLRFHQTDTDDYDSCSAIIIPTQPSQPERSLAYRFVFKGTVLVDLHITLDGKTTLFTKPGPMDSPLEVYANEPVESIKVQSQHAEDVGAESARIFVTEGASNTAAKGSVSSGSVR